MALLPNELGPRPVEVTSRHGRPPVLVLTVDHDPAQHARALQAGAEEVLTKDATIEGIAAAVKRVARGA